MRRHGGPIGVWIAAGLAACLALLTAPPSTAAQGIFESIFAGFRSALRQSGPPTDIHAYSEPTPHLFPAPNRSPDRILSYGGSRVTAYCVRTCDGHYFPLQPHAGLNVAQACRAFCPASKTRVYRGSTIDTAVARDGRRYVDLPNAYAYRRHLFAGCTCNGRDDFGLAPLEPLWDPTLKPGDVVVTSLGLIVFSGGKKASSRFTPVQNYSRFSRRYRNQLSSMRVAPPVPGAPGEFGPSASLASENRTDQLER